MMPTVTSASTYGTNTSSRNTVRPRKRRLSSSATPSAIGPWTSSEPTTMMALLRSASRKIGSWKARM